MYVTAGLQDGDLVSLTALDSTFAGATVDIVSRTKTNTRTQGQGESTVLPELADDTDRSAATALENPQSTVQSNAG